jgi:hypothetical protein
MAAITIPRRNRVTPITTAVGMGALPARFWSSDSPNSPARHPTTRSARPSKMLTRTMTTAQTTMKKIPPTTTESRVHAAMPTLSAS